MKKKAAVRIILAVWIIIWGIFLIRPYFKKGLLDRYASLLKLSAEEKRGYVTGEALYSFVKFCKESVKEPSTYQMEGIENNSIEQRRFKYYMYPDIESEDPKYIFVYKKEHFARDGYRVFSRMDHETYILARTD